MNHGTLAAVQNMYEHLRRTGFLLHHPRTTHVEGVEKVTAVRTRQAIG